ncbi:MAG TPA: aldo/keto reductase [Acidobacteriota bacterium]|jgi:aryl-alcohol dehydrogenase-like predicted oxidoreductase
MRTIQLGSTDIQVSRLALGGVTFGREIDERTSFAIMDHAIEAGITFFDTAETYGGGESREYRQATYGISDVRELSGEKHTSETIIGRWLKTNNCRNQIVLQTKIAKQFTRVHLWEALQASLNRLQTDIIDIYLFHSFDRNSPLQEGMEAMTMAVESGRVRVMGCCNFSLDELAAALNLSEQLGLARIEVVQSVYNLAFPEIERDIIPFCRAKRIGVTPYSPLGGGFFSGKYTSDRGSIPKRSRFDVIPGHVDFYFTNRNFRLIDWLREKERLTGIPIARLALSWVLRNPDLTSVLIGATKPEHLDNAIQAMEIPFPEEWATELAGL